MDDLISRQALCEYALNQKDRSITPNDIMRFPSAQPEVLACGSGELDVQDGWHWIPCAEQLPDTDEVMLVTCAPKKGGRNVNRAYYYDGAWHGSGTHAEVVAWMPMPLPYQEETT